jgi:hypothetical protein
MSRPLGRPHDPDGQRAVLRAMLELLASATGPDSYVELPFVWPESPAQARNASKGVPAAPIVGLLHKKPWLLTSLYSGRIPHAEGRSICHARTVGRGVAVRTNRQSSEALQELEPR